MPYKTTLKTVKTGGKKYKQSKITAASFQKAVKKVVYGVAETKSPLQSMNLGLTNDLLYAQNINFAVSQGSTADNIVGEKFHLKNIRFRGWITSVNSATLTNSSSSFRMLLIRTKKQLTNTISSITTSDVFRGLNTGIAMQGMVDLHKVTLLKDFTIRTSPEIINVNNHRLVSFNVPINKTHFVDTDNGGYLKDMNYYFIFTHSKEDSSIAGTTGILRGQWSFNFKDV